MTSNRAHDKNMNPRLALLHPYPFEKMRQLLATCAAPAENLPAINLSIGEPRHGTPAFIKKTMQDSAAGLASYPPTKGDSRLRETIAQWIARRYNIAAPNPETQVLPALGSREALFSFAQAVIDPNANAYVICPNPFYQIYEGAAILAGAQPYYINSEPERKFGYNWASIPKDVWQRTQLVFVCSPGNPAGNVMTLDEWKSLFSLSDEYGFIIAADECYSEIYFDENNQPLGALQAASQLGRDHYNNLVCFSSLSKRSNVPGLRSGFVAGDAQVMSNFLRYRTYHGSAMSAVVAQTSIAAWQDEHHVVENRRLYKEKFEAVLPILQPFLQVEKPQAGFYLWAQTSYADTEFTCNLYSHTAITVLPGSYLARTAHGINPGTNRIRMALVDNKAQCIEAAQRIALFLQR